MKHLFTIVCTLPLLAACAGIAPTTRVNADDVIQQFQDAGLELTDIQEPARDPESPLPNSYGENVTFNYAELGDGGGQIFTCDTRDNCDRVYAYFESLEDLAGPYLYRSEAGTVIAQLNSRLTPDQAAVFEDVINGL